MISNDSQMASAPSFLAGSDRLWRLIGTGISFALFGLGGLILGLIVFPVIWLVVRNLDRRRKLGRSIVCRAFWVFVLIMKGLRVIDYQISGNIDQSQTGRLIVANHPSLIDVVFLIGMFKGVDCVVKSAMWRNPFTALTVQSAGYIRNDAPDILMEECIERLKMGRNLILFPEGTRSRPYSDPEFKRGAATIALRAGAEVLPVRIRCNPPTLTRGERWYQTPITRPQFSLEILKAIRTDSYLEKSPNEKKASLELTKDLKHLLASRVEIADQTR